MKAWLWRHRRRTLGALAALAIALGVWRSLPDPLFEQPLSSVLQARDGTLLGARIADDGQWRFPPTDQVPQKFRRALITFEDKRFEQHPGVDPL
ncbi:MAG: transglycosylase domain-containing protein, partial [Hylemonella sp.]